MPHRNVATTPKNACKEGLPETRDPPLACRRIRNLTALAGHGRVAKPAPSRGTSMRTGETMHCRVSDFHFCFWPMAATHLVRAADGAVDRVAAEQRTSQNGPQNRPSRPATEPKLRPRMHDTTQYPEPRRPIPYTGRKVVKMAPKVSSCVSRVSLFSLAARRFVFSIIMHHASGRAPVWGALWVGVKSGALSEPRALAVIVREKPLGGVSSAEAPSECRFQSPIRIADDTATASRHIFGAGFACLEVIFGGPRPRGMGDSGGDPVAALAARLAALDQHGDTLNGLHGGGVDGEAALRQRLQ